MVVNCLFARPTQPPPDRRPVCVGHNCVAGDVCIWVVGVCTGSVHGVLVWGTCVVLLYCVCIS